MSEETKVETEATETETQTDVTPAEKPVDYAKLQREFNKTQRELEKYKAKIKSDEDAKLSSEQKLQKELDLYKSKAALVDQFELDYQEQRDELLNTLSEDRRANLESLCDGLDIRKQIRLIKEIAKSSASDASKSKEAEAITLAEQKARNTHVYRSPPSDGSVNFYEDYQALPQSERFKILSTRGKNWVTSLPKRS